MFREHIGVSAIQLLNVINGYICLNIKNINNSCLGDFEFINDHMTVTYLLPPLYTYIQYNVQ
jgi:hypothetical protein